MNRSMTVNIAAALAGLLGLAGCHDEPVLDFPDLAAPVLVDMNPDPAVVEVVLIAGTAEAEYLPGKRAPVWGYRDALRPGARGLVPGPVLDVNRGDRVIAHFHNELPVELTVHWHGVRLPNLSDGTPASQIPVPPGGSYTYDFVAQDAGTFWYHPHVHADQYIERGLYGMMRVREEVPLAVAADRLFVLDDVKLDADGQLATRTDPLDIMLGRQGNFLIINGRPRSRLAVGAGTRERWRFVNSANGRFFNLRMNDRPFQVIAWDGGLLPQPYQTDRVLIAPGERYEVLVTFDEADVERPLVLQTVHYDRGHNIPDPGPLDLLEVHVQPGAPGLPLPQLPSVWGEWRPLTVGPATPVRVFRLKEEEHGGEVKFFINEHAFPEHAAIFGGEREVEIWEVRNETEMDHPFHLHGMFFQVLDVNGVSPLIRGLKDTVNVPQKATLRFAVQYGPPGAWMYHCHILEHAERGMMGELRIMAQ